jgi:hypothetical protein
LVAAFADTLPQLHAHKTHWPSGEQIRYEKLIPRTAQEASPRNSTLPKDDIDVAWVVVMGSHVIGCEVMRYCPVLSRPRTCAQKLDLLSGHGHEARFGVWNS